MSASTIAVIDTGICNLRSVTKAIEAAGGLVNIVSTRSELAASRAGGLVLPGVGALRDCVASLRQSGLGDAVTDWIRSDQPFLGVCLGMQALFERSEEGGVRGLGVFPGQVVRFKRPAEFKVPHMGWNSVRFVQEGAPLARGLRKAGETFYFVHSYHCEPDDPNLVLAECDYGGVFCAALAIGRVAATQFHPEKSQATGLSIYRNFVALTSASDVEPGPSLLGDLNR